MNSTIKLDAPAKINLLLDIVRLLPNGYHSLFMVMQSVSLYDTVELTLNDSGTVTAECSEKSLPTDRRNIAVRAAEGFFEVTGQKCGVHISITKRIPMAAGLAGGSTDAAAVLKGLNQLCGTGLSKQELCNIGVKLGADVPFCIMGGTMLAQDIGQVLSPLPPIADCAIVLAKPNCGVSTKEAYAEFDSCESVHHPDCVGMLNALANSDFAAATQLISNVFEQFIEVPERIDIKAVMRASGAVNCCMSGSGPTVFGIFDSDEKAKACVAKLKERYEQVYLTRPVQ